jgi:undecaprenyl-diphosphatase
VAVSFVPTAIVGFLLARVITDVFFEDERLQLGAFALVGVLFIVAERAWRDRPLERDPHQLDYREAALVGLAQALAVVPGVSRAGAVMLALMALGVSRDAAARYSFLLALPTIVAASAFDLVREREVLAAASDGLLLLGVGLLVSFVTALLVMRWFIGYLQRHSLVAFGAYRLVVAAALGALLALGR